MNLNNFAEIANTIENRLVLKDGFEFIVSQQLGTNITIKHYTTHKVNSVSIGFTHYNKYQLNTIAAGIAFTDLNKVLSKVYFGFNIDSVNIKNSISIKTEGYDSGKNVYPFIPLELNSVDQIFKACELIKVFLNEDAYPFFNRWEKLSDLIPLLEKLNQRDISEIFGGSGVPEKALIWYLYDHPEKEIYLDGWINKYKNKAEENPDEDAYKEHLERLLNVKQASLNITLPKRNL